MSFYQLTYIIPPLLALLLVIITKKPILSLIISIVSGLFVLYGMNILPNTFVILKKILMNGWNIKLIFGLLILGGFIGIIEKQFHNKDVIISKFFNSKKKVLLIGWLSGLLLFIDDYFNILLNGVFLNSITKKYNISKAKIAYLIHSLGVTSCVLIPFSTWTVYIISIIKNLNLENGFGIYVHSIPYNFYAISLVFITLAVILYEINILGMKKEEDSQKLISYKSSKNGSLSIKELLLPAVMLIFVSFILISINVIYLLKNNVRSIAEIIAKLNFTDILFYLSIISTIFVVIYFYNKTNNLKFILKSFVFGSKQMSSAVVILILAWVLGEVTIKLNTASIIIEASKGFLSSGVIVLAVFIITAILAFMTSSWAMFAIAIPILLPLGMAQGINPSLIVAAIVSGGIFGDHTSPLSSTTILTKAVAKIEIDKHFHTQLPYNLISFVISGYLFFLIGGVK